MWLCEGKPYVLGRWWDGLCGPHTLGCQLCLLWGLPQGRFRIAARRIARWSKLGDCPDRKGPGVSDILFLLDWGGSVWCAKTMRVFLVLHACLDQDQFLHQGSTRFCHVAKKAGHCFQ